MNASKNSEGEDASLPLSALRLIAPPLRLVSASMWKVMQQRDAVNYGKLEEIVTSICDTVHGLLHYRHQARLSMGLRALLILEELRQSDPPDAEHVLRELDKLQSSSPANGRRKDLKVEEAKRNFHTLVHCLLKNHAARQQFFKEDFPQHYGENYIASLEKLLWEFLIRLDQLLPVPDLGQTASWITATPAVLEECARTASQPHLIRTLLQHEACLGHLGSASLLSSTGESILSSLSLPLSGRVQQTIRSETTPTSNHVISPTITEPRATHRLAKEALSQVAPVIGSISYHSLPKNNLPRNGVASSLANEVESASETSANTRCKLRTCSKKTALEKDPGEEHVVGDMLITVISQSSGSEVEEDLDDKSDSEKSREEETLPNSKSTFKNKNRKYIMRNSSKINSRSTCSQEEADLDALHISCMKRQLRVVIPRLNVNGDNLCVHHLSDEQKATRSPCQTNDTSSVGSSRSVNRKRIFSDWTPKPEKYLAVNKPSSACSPCIPPVLRFPMASPETPSSVADSTDDIIIDSEDERSEKVKRKVFTQRYCKTKNGTYVPTLQEFWNPAIYHRDIVSPGNRC
ncbi:TERF1-interacting nuclear factor 2 [Triplophysa dalaica]|uniref:TERF1-interacting nuclear factor 2 n=1 Tax=Triplophysa dalaica TaxID=1582913 RepID=UPI0024DFA507|nr:TERF1-interacting nuclear factor 2 [Triplophysa dalaica]